MPAGTTHRPWRDIRLIGFADRAPLAQAWRWLDAAGSVPGHETVPAENATGRVLAETVAAPKDLPPADLAAADGYAVRAADTEDASAYNPLPFALSDAASAARAHLISAGTALPSGCDAILDFGTVSRIDADRAEVLEPVARGEGVAARGSLIRAGTVALAAGRRLRPQDLALLAALGIARVAVLRRPLVGLAIAGSKTGGVDQLGPMLRALTTRDGGVPAGPGRMTFKAAVAEAGAADVILIAGRSGTGEDDIAGLALAEAGGTRALHGIALRPGGSSGLGQLGAVPVILLPGDPLACLAAYDMLAGRLIRRIAGLSTDLPYRIGALPLSRKIVSSTGFTDIVPVAVSGDEAAPIGSVETGHLAASCRAAGFVMVPETLEGYAAGDIVRVHLYD
ncbi:molybdopterin-binding protein [Acidiphilium iwatense]|uniref:Molybdopterin molybdenumtransferase n=1 Tax=Acidiphilium iwatense TaxID=768198 RepID=A0ABS9DWB5_9PROT|nr:molybdopterin-binding protein [Acidiphilium iwatense]MCF3947026.1 molybdopterin-binding protein [Acidiphilium iwatense]